LTESILEACKSGDIDAACIQLEGVLAEGYSSMDFISTTFRVLQRMDTITEDLRLEWIKYLSFTHMRVADGLGTNIQLTGLLGQMCERALNIQEDFLY